VLLSGKGGLQTGWEHIRRGQRLRSACQLSRSAIAAHGVGVLRTGTSFSGEDFLHVRHFPRV
jgi:hypothetical protein